MDGKSLDITAALVAQLKAIMPDVFSEDKIDFQRLKTALGEDTFVQGEHYELSWAGKSEARKEIQKQTTATLVPNRADSVDFDHANHIFIEGENLEVLRTLQKSYFGKVKMIYIDPPYNTGNDSFVYPDDYAERQDAYKKRTGITDQEGYLNKQDLWKKNVKENGQFHSVWLSMMYPRLYLSRNLLREDGVIFISIDDNEAANLKLLCDEVFGAENHVATLIWKRRQNVDSRSKTGASVDHEYVICYRKSDSGLIRGADKDLDKYSNPDNDERGDWMSADMTGLATADQRPNLHYDLENPNTGIIYKCPPTGWRYEKERMRKMIAAGEVIFPSKPEGRPRRKKFLKDVLSEFTGFSTLMEASYNLQGTRELRALFDDKEYFDFPKPTDLIKKLANQGTSSNSSDLILDFFAGSGTTAQAVMELNEEDGGNRRFICVQMPEKTEEGSEAYKAGYRTIADITQARIKKVIEKIEKERQAKAEKAKGELFNSENTPPQYPLGFQSYKLAASHFKQWNKEVTGEQALLEQLDMFQQAEIANSLPENMLYELLLKSGFDLSTRVEKRPVGEAAHIYDVADGKLWVLFDRYTDEIKTHILSASPARLICLDSCFGGDDVALTNFQLELRENHIDLTII